MSERPFSRVWAMPTPNTFEIPEIAELLDKYLAGCVAVVDPFAGSSTRAHFSNDLAVVGGEDAETWCSRLIAAGVKADAVLFDPPYSPRQILEVYRKVGLAVGRRETQNGRLYKAVRDALDNLLVDGGVAVSCGWNSAGFGISRGYEFLDGRLVAHGGAHNDTIVVVERKARARKGHHA